jgi:sortase A
MKKLNFVISYGLLALGLFVFYQGARLYIDAHAGQTEARREFTHAQASAVTPESAAVPAPPAQDGQPIAKLTIPRLDAELYVVEGDDEQDLELGPGHMPGTAMPGVDGNCVIAGHRDTHFRILKDIQEGDEIDLETSQGRFVYRVDGLHVVRPTNTKALDPTPDGELHLITCYPFYYLGSAPKRFVVQAKLEGTAADAP